MLLQSFDDIATPVSRQCGGGAIGAYSFLYQRSWGTSLLIGFSFALSSTAFVLQLLHEKGEFGSRLEASLRLGAEVMSSLGIASHNINEFLGGAREDDYALVREESAVSRAVRSRDSKTSKAGIVAGGE